MANEDNTKRTQTSRANGSARTSAGKTPTRRTASSGTSKRASHASQGSAQKTPKQRTAKQAQTRSSNASKRSAARLGTKAETQRKRKEGSSVDLSKVTDSVASGAGNAFNTIFSSKKLTILALVIVILLAGGIADTLANMGKTYGNVYVAGVDVGGLTADEVDAKLRNELSTQVTHAQALDELRLPTLDQGDFILGWKNKPNAYRYCHHFAEEEIDALAASVADRADVAARFLADGRTGDMNSYLVLRVR